MFFACFHCSSVIGLGRVSLNRFWMAERTSAIGTPFTDLIFAGWKELSISPPVSLRLGSFDPNLSQPDASTTASESADATRANDGITNRVRARRSLRIFI